MTAAQVASIWRYPIKGFGGEKLDSATLTPGQGVPFDRCLALTNGTRAVPDGEGWVPCQNFIRLTKNPELPAYAIRFDQEKGVAELMAPDGGTAILRLGDDHHASSAENALRSWFEVGPLGGPRPVTRSRSEGGGWWDHEDAAISIINPATVALLETDGVEALDPMRFRGNLLLDGMAPLAELGLLGRRVRIGEAVLEIVRPIDRCRATSVDPTTGSQGPNVPALLARRLGHVFCGVYARVVEGGLVAPGDAIEDAGPAAGAIRDGTAASTAPPARDWPRLAQVTAVVAETENVVSLWLEDPLASLREPVEPGQHIRVHLLGPAGQPEWRCYTVSGVDEQRLRISVKRDGVFSRQLTHCRPEQSLLISGPFGDTYLRRAVIDAPLVLISAGIGITPSIAMLRHLVEAGEARPALALHVARSPADLALWCELRALTERLPSGNARLYLTKADGDVCRALGAYPGRPSFDEALQELFLPTAAEAYICGPTKFTAEARAALARVGVPTERIHAEVFISPRVNTSISPASPEAPAGPFRVCFTTGAAQAIWTPAAGTLLELAESVGLSPAANCRSGVCGACRTPVVKGRVVHHPEPITPPADGMAYLCCATPICDVVIA